VNISQTDYTYYFNGNTGGNTGDLASATMEDGAGNPIDVSYYRYWLSGQTAGGVAQPVDKLKYYLSGPSTARAEANLPSGYTMLTAADSALAPYADRYFAYDSDGNPAEAVQQGAGCSSCSGGQGTFGYNYSTNLAVDTTDYNCWALKVAESMPDGTTQYHYFNPFGEEMLAIDSNGGGTFTEYDSNGLPILVAQPSAVNIPSLTTIESYNDLLHKVSGNYQYLNDSTGLVNMTTYYGGSSPTATSTTPGGVPGYIEATYVQQGELGYGGSSQLEQRS
jgi:hypothetical protein